MGASLAHLPRVFLPVLWFSAEANTTEDMVDQIWYLVHMPTLARYTTTCWYTYPLSPGTQQNMLVHIPTIARYTTTC